MRGTWSGRVAAALALGGGLALASAPLSLLACSRAQLGAAQAGEKEAFGELTVDQVDKLIQDKSGLIFDNNSKTRWEKSHVPTAKWVQFSDVKAEDLPADKGTTLVFYCANPH